MVKVKNLTADARVLEVDKAAIEVDPGEEFEVPESVAYGDEWSSGLYLQPEVWFVPPQVTAKRPAKKASAKADPSKEK